MSDIDPFKQPPLVEWDNCVTHEELHWIRCEFLDYYATIPKWRFIKRIKFMAVINALAGVCGWITEGKPYPKEN